MELLEIACALNELKAYKDTGLTPDKYKSYAEAVKKLDVAHMHDLLQAEKDGRMVVFAEGAMRPSAPDDDLIKLVRPTGDFSVKPCPFCGGNNILYLQYKHPAGLRWRIVCVDCMAMIDPGWLREYGFLAELWNKRVDSRKNAEAALKGSNEE